MYNNSDLLFISKAVNTGLYGDTDDGNPMEFLSKYFVGILQCYASLARKIFATPAPDQV